MYTSEPDESGKQRQVVMAAVLLLVALAVGYLPAETQQTISSALRASVLQPFVQVQDWLVAARARASEVERLTRQLDSVTTALTASRTLAEENRRLRGLLDLRERLGTSFVAASLIRPRTEGSASIFVLDVGRDSGVAEFAPVITRHGLLGVVREVGPSTSSGTDWTYPDFGASAMNVEGLVFGIVESRRPALGEPRRLIFDGIAYHEDLAAGTVVVTSGLGGVYPRGIPLGRVVEAAEAESGWRRSYWLEPFVDPGAPTHVLVGQEAVDLDLTGVWDPIETASSLVARERAARDSLATLADSVRALRARLGLDSLAAPPDSVPAARPDSRR